MKRGPCACSCYRCPEFQQRFPHFKIDLCDLFSSPGTHPATRGRTLLSSRRGAALCHAAFKPRTICEDRCEKFSCLALENWATSVGLPYAAEQEGVAFYLARNEVCMCVCFPRGFVENNARDQQASADNVVPTRLNRVRAVEAYENCHHRYRHSDHALCWIVSTEHLVDLPGLAVYGI